MRRSLALVSLALLALTGCSSSGGTAAAACKQQYWDGTLGVCLPTNWKVLDSETLKERGVPAEVVTAFQSSVAVSGQNPTVTVTKETIQSNVDALAYNQASIRAVVSLPAYKLIDTRKVKIDGVSLDLHVFSAQPLAEEPEHRFYQLSTASKGMGYTLTALTPLSVASGLETEITTIMKSLTFKDPTPIEAAK